MVHRLNLRRNVFAQIPHFLEIAFTKQPLLTDVWSREPSELTYQADCSSTSAR
jgi:hypothetical protein